MSTSYELSTQDWIVRMNPKSHPRELVVEVTTLCNMNCLHCFRRTAQSLSQCIMSLRMFEQIFSEIVENNVEKIVFSGWGEPLMHPDIERMIKMCKDVGLKIAINTNGLMIDKFMNTLLNYVDELYISLDAATHKTYDVLRQSNTFGYLVQAISKLINIKQLQGQLKPIVKAVFTITSLNLDEVEPFLKIIIGLGINEVVFTAAIPHGPLDIGCLYSIECLEKFHTKFDNAIKSLKELGISIVAPQKFYTIVPSCPFALRRALFVRCDGGVAPCIHYAYSWTPHILGIDRYIKEVILGYIGRDKLIDIWRDKYARMFYRLYFRRVPSCIACNLANYCAKTRTNDADCLGGKPNCGHCPYYHSLSYCPL